MPPRTSKLCKKFPEILNDGSSLSVLDYFIQYMESVGALRIIQFWFSVESFKGAIMLPTAKTIGGQSVVHSSGIGTDGHPCEETSCQTTKTAGNPISTDVRHEELVDKKTSFKVLRRRDTENHKYCNCMIQQRQPNSPESLNLQTSSDVVLPPDHGGSRIFHHTCEHASPVDKASQPPHSGLLQSRHQPRIKSENRSSSLTLETDAIGIYSRYLALNAIEPVGVTNEIRQRVEVNICPEDGRISKSCFDEAQDFVCGVMEKRYYLGFLHSSFLCKYQLDYIASGDLNLVDFLMGENALSYLMEFMEQEGASTLLQFWMMADNFHHQLSSPDHIHDINIDTTDAIAIYDRYFSLQAIQPLNMEDSVRIDVENRICDKHGPRPDSYLRPQLVAFHTMNEVHFPAFVESSIYLRFLNELVHMLNHEDDPVQQAKPQTLDASPQGTVSKLDHIPGRDIDDPDSLWERPAVLFRLGFINKFGEYISEIDPIPIKSSKKDSGNFYMWSISARVLRKQRKEEELAMKITRNIIKEVMNSFVNS